MRPSKQTNTNISPVSTMHATIARRALGNLVPPKVATPSSVVRVSFLSILLIEFLTLPHAQSGGSSAALLPLVEFYSKLPKGPAPTYGRRGPIAWFSNAKNSSGFPILVIIAGLVGFGYTLDYNSTSGIFLFHWHYSLSNYPTLLQCT